MPARSAFSVYFGREPFTPGKTKGLARISVKPVKK